MLVLSRRAKEKIVFPNLAITVELLQVRGKMVKIGIDAPKEVSIIRPDACSEGELEEMKRKAPPLIGSHQFRNRLNTLNLGLHLCSKQVDAGMTEEAVTTLKRLLAELKELDVAVGQDRETLRREKSGENGRSLLVVEDDDNERELLAGLLRMYGFNVSVAKDGQAALEHLALNDLPDYVLLDLSMPRFDGPATLRVLRNDPRMSKLKVFAVTGSDPKQFADDGDDTEDRFDAWFRKPLDPAEIVEAVSQKARPAIAAR
ncbi:response regulator [Blastopirellula sp. JC732]|uniref:Translational regulator CsrA n=1 Tax=Blastopirellula sediminis TaxID=2894196 RepID=A0A9X1SLR7_9BACT|nr:response regulator [Blastopirellula sediminis]MCC9605741.1 response regulator [Blastopirellula sediminis]MCC9630959.1 response regulator [Blastopirellula sediminis]